LTRNTDKAKRPEKNLRPRPRNIPIRNVSRASLNACRFKPESKLRFTKGTLTFKSGASHHVNKKFKRFTKGYAACGDDGTVFKVNTDGTGFNNLHSFSGLETNNANGDGAFPIGALVLSSNTLYSTASQGGNSGNGTIFKVNTDGTDFGSLYSFTPPSLAPSTNSDGALPQGGLAFSGNTLYGTANQGGSKGSGTVFSFSLTPKLTILWISSSPHTRLLWSTNASGYNLQASPTLVSSVWTNVSPAPVISGGQNAVTKPVVGPQQFYRLSQQ